MEEAMKRVALFLIVVLAILVSLPDPGNAQTSATPTLNSTLYRYRLADAKQYANSQTDTLPQPLAAGTVVTFRGAPSMAAIRIAAADSCTVDITVKRRVIGATAWATVIADSLKSSTTIVPAKEFPLRNHATDNLTDLGCEYFVIVAFRSSGNGGGSKPATKKYTLDFLWKP
jgi:hypothetical protein